MNANCLSNRPIASIFNSENVARRALFWITNELKRRGLYNCSFGLSGISVRYVIVGCVGSRCLEATATRRRRRIDDLQLNFLENLRSASICFSQPFLAIIEAQRSGVVCKQTTHERPALNDVTKRHTNDRDMLKINTASTERAATASQPRLEYTKTKKKRPSTGRARV